ncbi:hypothetical protein EG328_008735 [Venturia inaequalis]|uniref:SAP domain-containing protein n=1 Tax=Venturia inaequalis TaxID=5025 RepID=A0A8H3V9F5_VENIN|nr:hypothetical protein EG328_008735 [Venturia inaequalis]
MAYEDMPAKALKHIYKDRELAHSGKKPEVIARLGEHSQNKLKRKPPENDNTEQDKKERTSKKAKIEGGDPDYDKQNVKRLQDLCFSRRLSEKPSDKAALIARLEANDRGEDEPGQECPICGNVRAFKFYGHSSHGSHDASANQSKGCGQEYIQSSTNRTTRPISAQNRGAHTRNTKLSTYAKRPHVQKEA